MYFVRDVLHGYIDFDELDRVLIDSPIFQRLRYVRQNDVAFLVYPSMNTTRFEHSLGVMHIGGRLAKAALENSNPDDSQNYLDSLHSSIPTEIRPDRKKVAEVFVRATRWYGLLHDIGHLPFSHLTEQCLSSKVKECYPDEHKMGFEKMHEAAGNYIVNHNAELQSAFQSDLAASWLVKKLMSSKKAESSVFKPFKDMIDSDVDADRIDATARDGLLAGGDFGKYDIERLTRSACLCVDEDEWRIFFTTQALSAVESLLLERYKTHRWIHYHHRVATLKNSFRFCFNQIQPDVSAYHAQKYTSGCTVLGDDSVLKLIREHSDTSGEFFNEAQKAICLRSKDARSVWKRADEYRAISKKIASAKQEWKEHEDSEAAPILSRLAKEVQIFERDLNEEAKGLHFLISRTQLDPFSQSQFNERVSNHKLIRHRERKPTLLSTESKIIVALKEAVKRDPAIAVTVLGDPDGARKDEIEALFISCCVSYLKKLI